MTMRKKGFTLIELLVVIAIIGILAALIIVSLSAAESRATDANLKSNTRNLGTALAQHYQENGNKYPLAGGQITNSEPGGAFNPASTFAVGVIPYLSGGTFLTIAKFPSVGAAYRTHADGSIYILATGLRSTSETPDPTGNGIRATSAGTGDGTAACSIGATAGRVCVNITTVKGIGLTAITGGKTNTASIDNRAFVVYGPQ